MAYDEELAHQVRSCLAGEDGVVEQRMFGGIAFLLGGNMAVAASGRGGLMVRVDRARTAELVAHPRAERMVMRGREMDGWIRVDVTGASDDEFAAWVDEGVHAARALPPK